MPPDLPSTPRPDPLPGLVGFARSLRHAGLAVDGHRVAAYLVALGHLGMASPARAYWAGRLTLCSQPDDLAHYDAAFAAWFQGGDTARGRAVFRQRQRQSTQCVKRRSRFGI